MCGIDTREVVKNIRGRAMKARIAFKRDLFFPAREPVCFAAAPRLSEAKRDESIKSVLVIGSGPIVIGQAAEFDYAGAQACRVLKAEGVRTVLVNSNPATIMTDKALADAIYLEPLTIETIRRVIVKERPDSLLASLGGQTGLTLAMQLGKEGFCKSTAYGCSARARTLSTGPKTASCSKKRWKNSANPSFPPRPRATSKRR